MIEGAAVGRSFAFHGAYYRSHDTTYGKVSKRTCLDSALGLWAKVMLAWLQETSDIDWEECQREIPAQFGSIKPEEFRSFSYLLIPQATVSLMSESLSTPKLETFVMERVHDCRVVIRAFAVFLALDSITKESTSSAKDLLKDFGKNSIISQALFMKLMTLYLFDAPGGKIELLRECIADAFTVMRGGTLADSAVWKGRFLAQLDRRVLECKELSIGKRH